MGLIRAHLQLPSAVVSGLDLLILCLIDTTQTLLATAERLPGNLLNLLRLERAFDAVGGCRLRELASQLASPPAESPWRWLALPLWRHLSATLQPR